MLNTLIKSAVAGCSPLTRFTWTPNYTHNTTESGLSLPCLAPSLAAVVPPVGDKLGVELLAAAAPSA